MLVLTRKVGEQIVLPDSKVTITVLAIRGNQIRVGVAAPAAVAVHRAEVWQCLQKSGDLSPPAPSPAK